MTDVDTEAKPLCDHANFAEKFCVNVLSRSKDGNRLTVAFRLREGGSKSLTMHLVKDVTGVYWINRHGDAFARVGEI